MKKLKVLGALFGLLLIASTASASLEITDGSTSKGSAKEINFGSGLTVSKSAGVHTVDVGGAISVSTITSTAITATTVNGTTITASTHLNDASLTASQAVATDSSKNLTTSFASAALTSSLTDETGSGVAVFATSPSLVTPVLGAATATSITATGNLTFQTNLVTNGRYGANSTVLFSSSTTLQQAGVPYAIVYKAIGNNPTTETTKLPAGTAGQETIFEVYAVSGGTWTLQPDTAGGVIGTGWTSLKFTAVGQEAVLLYLNSTLGYIVKSNNVNTFTVPTLL